MEFTVTAKGPTFDQLTRNTVRDLKKANRTAGKAMGKAGTAAANKGAPHMFGRALRVKADVQAYADRATVEFNPAKRQSGPWAIADTGRRGGYTVKPRRARALHYAGRFAMVTHPKRVAGRGAWGKATARIAKATKRAVTDTYDDALGA